MIRNFEEFCLELNACGFSMGGGNAKESYEKIHQQILLLNPTAEEKTIRKFIRGERRRCKMEVRI